MGLNLKQVHDNKSAGGYVKTTTLRDYPLVLVHVLRYGEKQNYQKDGTADYIIGNFVALDNNDKVVLSQAEAMWEMNRFTDKTYGNYRKSVIIQSFLENGISPGDDVVGKIIQPKRANIWESITPTDKQIKVLTKALEDLSAGQAEAPKHEQEQVKGWADDNDEPAPF